MMKPLDLDVTDDLVHGNQEQVFFNTYYGGFGGLVQIKSSANRIE